MFTLLALTNGLLAVLARVVNASLSDHIGDLRGSLVNHAVGLAVVGLLLILGIGTGTLRVAGVAPLYLSGGILGVLVVAASNYAVRHGGAVLFTVLLITFQLVGSAVIDHFGWFGQSPIALSWTRILGLGLLITGAIFVVTDRAVLDETDAPPSPSSGSEGD